VAELMRAVRFHEYGGWEALRAERITVPDPGPGEVRLRVLACGVNRADLLSRAGQIRGQGGLPHTPGGEVAGEVVAGGDGVVEWKPGDRVLVNPVLFCGACPMCARGEDNLCARSQVFGFDTEGGYAEYAVAPARHLLRLPPALSHATAAAIAAAGSTAWHMLVRRAEIGAGDEVLVLAAGSGIGVYAVQIARLLGARVLATAGSGEKREKAKALGADVVIDHGQPGWWRQVRAATGGRGVSLVFEHVGAATWDDSVRSLAPMGRLVTCGAHTGARVPLDLWPLFAKQISLIGSFAASRADLARVLDLAARGDLQAVIHRTLPLEQAGEAHRMLEAREAFGTLVLVPGGAA
jgi:NADPH:quinone reductase-like Zn-dependent oxidoreductase